MYLTQSSQREELRQWIVCVFPTSSLGQVRFFGLELEPDQVFRCNSLSWLGQISLERLAKVSEPHDADIFLQDCQPLEAFYITVSDRFTKSPIGGWPLQFGTRSNYALPQADYIEVVPFLNPSFPWPQVNSASLDQLSLDRLSMILHRTLNDRTSQWWMFRALRFICLTVVEWEHLVHCQQQHTPYFTNIGDLPSYPSRRLFDIHLVPPPVPLLQWSKRSLPCWSFYFHLGSIGIFCEKWFEHSTEHGDNRKEWLTLKPKLRIPLEYFRNTDWAVVFETKKTQTDPEASLRFRVGCSFALSGYVSLRREHTRNLCPLDYRQVQEPFLQPNLLIDK